MLMITQGMTVDRVLQVSYNFFAYTCLTLAIDEVSNVSRMKTE